MKALEFDTETTGKWDFKAPSDADHQPHMVQLAFRLIDVEKDRVYKTYSAIIKPTLYSEIEEGAAKVHGITVEDAELYGVSLDKALAEFNDALNAADLYVCHNTQFDSRIVGRAAKLDGGIEVDLKNKPSFCTMMKTTDIVRIPSARGYKWPKLIELHQYLFGEDFSGAHDALVDVLAMERCFVELYRRGNVPGLARLAA